MNSIFSIDDFSDPFWESSPPLDSDSAKVVTADEWTVEMFLEEIASSVSSEPVGNNNEKNNNNAIVGVSSAQSLPSVSGQNDFEEDSRFRRDSDEYRRVLENKLETECATVVALRAGSVKPEDSTGSPETLFPPAQSSPLTQGSLVTPGEVGVTSSLLAEVKKSGVPIKQVTSGSSRDYSDDDDLDEENETTGSLKPEDVKKSRRMLSNRESARRSRRRKQEQTCDLETQVNELKGEHSSLLKQLSNMNHKYDDAAVGILFQDLGKHSSEAFRDELGFVMRSATTALNCLDKWVVPKKSNLPLLFYPATGKVISEPYGTVLVLSSWNFPISLSLDPMIGAIAAGNTVLLKASELSPNASALLAKLIPSYLDTKAIKVIEGGPDVATILLQHQWDKIFFTGSPKIGKIIMAAAAEHLTPVTLELGGKCPTIIDHHSVSKDMKSVVKRISGGKWGSCSGQACISVDYVLVEQSFASTLIDMFKPVIRSFFGENPKESGCLSKIVTKKHFQRLSRLLNDPRVKASIVYGGSMDEEKLYVEPTILLDPPLDSEIMNEEIFGPILPIITLRDIQESIGFIKSKPKPLAIYAFTNDKNLKTRILSETSSGSVTFNDLMIQYMCDALPFGGVGQSGMGRYHGKYSFECFSHEKAIMEGSLAMDLEARYPPWNNFKLNFIRLAFREAYFKLVLLMLGLTKGVRK